MALSIRLLGGFALVDDGERLRPTLTSQRLLAFLALHGATSRPRVSEALWPDLALRQGLASLRTLVWRAHKVAPGLVDADAAGLALGPGVAVDVEGLIRLATGFARAPRSTDLPGIVALADTLCAGVLLPSWDEDWVAAERDHLEQLRLHTLEASVRRLVTASELDLALLLALETVRSEPLRESATACLMRVYLAEGNVAAALDRYEAFRDLLGRELGIEPTAQLAAVLPPRLRRDGRADGDGRAGPARVAAPAATPGWGFRPPASVRAR